MSFRLSILSISLLYTSQVYASLDLNVNANLHFFRSICKLLWAQREACIIFCQHCQHITLIGLEVSIEKVLFHFHFRFLAHSLLFSCTCISWNSFQKTNWIKWTTNPTLRKKLQIKRKMNSIFSLTRTPMRMMTSNSMMLVRSFIHLVIQSFIRSFVR